MPLPEPRAAPLHRAGMGTQGPGGALLGHQMHPGETIGAGRDLDRPVGHREDGGEVRPRHLHPVAVQRGLRPLAALRRGTGPGPRALLGAGCLGIGRRWPEPVVPAAQPVRQRRAAAGLLGVVAFRRGQRLRTDVTGDGDVVGSGLLLPLELIGQVPDVHGELHGRAVRGGGVVEEHGAGQQLPEAERGQRGAVAGPIAADLSAAAMGAEHRPSFAGCDLPGTRSARAAVAVRVPFHRAEEPGTRCHLSSLGMRFLPCIEGIGGQAPTGSGRTRSAAQPRRSDVGSSSSSRSHSSELVG